MTGHRTEAAETGVGSQARLLHVGGVAVPPKLAAMLSCHARRAPGGSQVLRTPHLPTHLMSGASPLAALARMKGVRAVYGGQQRKRAFSRVASSSRRTGGK